MKPYNDLSHISEEILFKAYSQGYNRLKMSIEGLTEDELKQKIIPGKWSIQEIVFHLADAEIMGASRIRQAISQNPREVYAFDPPTWSSVMLYNNATMEELEQNLQLFQFLRKTSLRIFKLATTADWNKTILHPDRGEVPLTTLLQVYADHSERHLEQILERRRLLNKEIKMEVYFTERTY